MVDFYWDVGTHYYSPMKGAFKNRNDFCKHLQRPKNDILVVGEAVSMKQGWVEGALESVENIIREV
jgi:monoamine oxidase